MKKAKHIRRVGRLCTPVYAAFTHIINVFQIKLPIKSENKTEPKRIIIY